MKKNLISIIIPNRATEKNETLPSIKKQIYKNYEVIEVIDKDCKGPSWARNQGLKKAKGEYLFWCDNDLELEPDCLENLFNALQKNKKAGWAFGKFIIDGVKFNENKNIELPEDIGTNFIDYFHGVSTMSLIRASAKPVWDENQIRYDDWDLWIRLTRAGHKPVFVDKILFKTVNRKGGISVSSEEVRVNAIKTLYKKHVRKIADIIIPHHDQHKMLADCLAQIDNSIFNIIIVSGGTFSENCNQGARIAKTDNLIFLNDDTIPVLECLIEMTKDKSDITGVAQYIPAMNATKFGINLEIKEGKIIKKLAPSIDLVTVPSGYAFKVKKSVWEALGGLSEAYKNGGEDVDLFLRALEKGFKFGYITTPMQHLLSQSEDRHLFGNYNEKLFNETWEKRIKKIKFKKVKGTKTKDVIYFLKSDCFYNGKKMKKGDRIEVDFIHIDLLKNKGLI